jgi:DNA-binding FadR family transcriptional regulator
MKEFGHALPGAHAPASRANESIAAAIGRRIVGGEFPAGSILPNEAAWSAEYGVSRSVVREAIRFLAAKGLLVSRPRIGTRVEPRQRWSLLDPDVLDWHAQAPRQTEFLMSLQQFRRLFEPEAAALAAARRSEAQMAAISSACAAMGSAPTLAQRGVADLAFHMAILEASGNELLLPLGALIASALRRMFVAINAAAGDMRHAQELHVGIERAIAARDPAGARAAVHALLDNSDEMILKFSAPRIDA